MKFNGYFITTGAKNAMFTLRQTVTRESGSVINGVFHGRKWNVDEFVSTLTGDIETSIAKAKEICGYDLPAPEITLCDRAKPQAVDHTIFPYGKYAGCDLIETANEDIEYVMWFLKNCNNGKNEKRIEILKNCDAVKNHNAELKQKEEDAIQSAQAETDRINTELAKCEFVGEVGVRQEFTATVDKIIVGEGQWGYWTLTLMTDENGNKLSYFNEIRVGNGEADEGEVVKFKATVKSHDIKQHHITGCDFKQTALSRAGKAELIKSVAPDTRPDIRFEDISE